MAWTISVVDFNLEWMQWFCNQSSTFLSDFDTAPFKIFLDLRYTKTCLPDESWVVIILYLCPNIYTYLQRQLTFWFTTVFLSCGVERSLDSSPFSRCWSRRCWMFICRRVAPLLKDIFKICCCCCCLRGKCMRNRFRRNILKIISGRNCFIQVKEGSLYKIMWD